ncbi:MAG: DUF2946 family protein [Betaproteobacteria bacterium]|nr:DUF2946 family protein [Betaproteobacteria bacterium]
MDDIVRQALTKWPNVPDCYGWLLLDARGAFRMRDEAAQAADAPGDVIRHPALLSFIYRNYLRSAEGAWFFQNGPQRVYVKLAQTPFIARTDPNDGFVTHDGAPLNIIERVWITTDGQLILGCGERIAMLDDRDLDECLPMVQREGKPISDAQLLTWLEQPEHPLQFHHAGDLISIQRLRSGNLGQMLGFDPDPQPRT